MKGKALVGIITAVCIFCLAGVVNSAEFCVGTAGELTSSVITAVANGESDVIKIQQGTYLGNFQFSSDEDSDISILGGLVLRARKE